jgi:hypothetical protein
MRRELDVVVVAVAVNVMMSDWVEARRRSGLTREEMHEAVLIMLEWETGTPYITGGMWVVQKADRDTDRADTGRPPDAPHRRIDG